MAKSVEREAKKAMKKLHTTTKILIVVALIFGIAGGFLTCYLMSKNDVFDLKGAKSYQLELSAGGATFTYVEEGIEAIAFGQDVSGKVTVETTLSKDAAGHYIIPLDKEGVYTITYTVDSMKFDGTFGEEIKRVRSFFVSANEEDGRYE